MMRDKQELYRFGYKLLTFQAINIAVALAIGLALSCLKEMVLFLIVYVPLRSYAGGYHADGPVRCGFISAAIELAVAVVIKIPAAGGLYTMLLAGAAISEIMIYVFAPVAAKNKPLTESQVRSFRKKTRKILGLEIAAMAGLYLAGIWEMMTVIALCHIFVAGLLVAGKGIRFLGSPADGQT